jgi:hypothetical protein
MTERWFPDDDDEVEPFSRDEDLAVNPGDGDPAEEEAVRPIEVIQARWSDRDPSAHRLDALEARFDRLEQLLLAALDLDDDDGRPAHPPTPEEIERMNQHVAAHLDLAGDSTFDDHDEHVRLANRFAEAERRAAAGEGIDPAYTNGSLPEADGPGSRQPANRSTYRGE